MPMSSAVRQGPPVDVPTERNPVPSSVSPIIVTHDLERLARFYTGVAGATETRRTPDVGPTFYLGLRIGDSELGIVSDGSVEGAPAGRVVLSIEVPDVDAALSRVEAHGGQAPARRTTCRGASGSPTFRTPTATRST